jgi:hypothetical protein
VSRHGYVQSRAPFRTEKCNDVSKQPHLGTESVSYQPARITSAFRNRGKRCSGNAPANKELDCSTSHALIR